MSPPQPPTQALRLASWPAADMRVGDAERADIADRLSRHFSDGRLDEAEFGERLDRAMRAKTMADLSGLLSDLPETELGGPAPNGDRRHHRKMLKVQLERERQHLRHERRAHRRAERARRWRTMRWVPLLIAAIVGAVIIAHTLTHSIAAWLVIGLIAFFWLRPRATGGHHSDDHDGD
ncbi:MAG TPA: DUF1707 domain-containing protein [Streptosporangiaceae bacterium]